jgi:hypothetical protein
MKEMYSPITNSLYSLQLYPLLCFLADYAMHLIVFQCAHRVLCIIEWNREIKVQYTKAPTA